MGVLWDDRAWGEYVSWQEEDKKTLKKINDLVKDMMRSPLEGIGKPERLIGDLSGYWSRRIDEKNRIVYKLQDENIVIVSCKGHYDER